LEELEPELLAELNKEELEEFEEAGLEEALLELKEFDAEEEADSAEKEELPASPDSFGEEREEK